MVIEGARKKEREVEVQVVGEAETEAERRGFLLSLALRCGISSS